MYNFVHDCILFICVHTYVHVHFVKENSSMKLFFRGHNPSVCILIDFFFFDIFKGLQINFDEEIVLKNIVYVCMYICLQKTFNFKSSIPLCQSRNMHTHTLGHMSKYTNIYMYWFIITTTTITTRTITGLP